ncbi:beta-ketoacyl synthase chain length factor [Aurantivibrio plasticivorans]
MADIIISRWAAWAPGLQTLEDWQAWSLGEKEVQFGEPPVVSAIPAMLRRRLSSLGKMALSVAWPLMGEGVAIPSVFCSRHGELGRTVTLLKQLADEEDLSPTHFSLSVHNAIGGVASIARKDMSSITALAAGDEGLSVALLEAQMILDEQQCPEVLCVIYDEPPQAEFHCVTPSVPYAAAFVLSSVLPVDSPANRLTVELQSVESVDDEEGVPQAMHFIKFLLSGNAGDLRFAGKRHAWQWSKVV